MSMSTPSASTGVVSLTIREHPQIFHPQRGGLRAVEGKNFPYSGPVRIRLVPLLEEDEEEIPGEEVSRRAMRLGAHQTSHLANILFDESDNGNPDLNAWNGIAILLSGTIYEDGVGDRYVVSLVKIRHKLFAQMCNIKTMFGRDFHLPCIQS